jgi:hypothetical protein
MKYSRDNNKLKYELVTLNEANEAIVTVYSSL